MLGAWAGLRFLRGLGLAVSQEPGELGILLALGEEGLGAGLAGLLLAG
jgi:hypothetical protein